ncbi:MAG TPA: glycerate kinase [Gaiellaceae bacterium]
MRALACPASLKGVLSAREAASALAEGFARGGVEAEQAPIADGGEGTAEMLGARVVRSVPVHDAFGRPREAPVWALADGTIVVQSADAIPLDPGRLDVLAASSRGFGELIAAVPESPRLLVGLGGTATMDGGDGLLEVLSKLPAPTTVLCDTRATLLEAPGRFGPQKGATPEIVVELEERFRGRRFAEARGSGAAGGLGAALASLGAELVRGAQYLFELTAFYALAAGADLVVTGEGTVDRTTFEGKAPGEAVAVCEEVDVRCVLFGGVVEEGIEAVALSGDPARAREDLEELGLRLARQ